LWIGDYRRPRYGRTAMTMGGGGGERRRRIKAKPGRVQAWDGI
jgi:hypothetical protein